MILNFYTRHVAALGFGTCLAFTLLVLFRPFAASLRILLATYRSIVATGASPLASPVHDPSCRNEVDTESISTGQYVTS